METQPQLPESKHFRIERMAGGVYAAIHVDGGGAIGNAGIVDLGDRTLMYDSMFTPQAGRDLRAAAEAFFDRPIDMLIDSHWHNDHIWGNQAFDAGTNIISTEETRRMYIETRGHGAYDEFMAAAEANLEATKAGLAVAQGERERRETKLWVDYHQAVVDAKPVLRHRPPNLTFEGRMLFHGTKRTAELIAFENGHTESDAVLFLPQERIAFMSDLLFIDHMPYLGGGNPESLLYALEAVSNLNPRLLLPGHGPVGGVESLSVLAQYVRTLDGMASQMVEDGVAEETIDEMAIPEPYADWLFAAFFPVNMHFLYRRWLERTADS